MSNEAIKPLGMRVCFDVDGREVGCFINEMPQFKGNVLIDDVLQCVFKKFLHNGNPVVAIFPYALTREFVR